MQIVLTKKRRRTFHSRIKNWHTDQFLLTNETDIAARFPDCRTLLSTFGHLYSKLDHREQLFESNCRPEIENGTAVETTPLHGRPEICNRPPPAVNTARCHRLF
jgi:hypothetical protein